jgi:hypothetical protein
MLNSSAYASIDAEWVEFEFDGCQFAGWLWLMPMRNGDKVEVVAEKLGEGRYVAYAVKREGDDLVAIYPRAIVGWRAESRAYVRTWCWSSLIFTLLMWAFMVWGTIGTSAWHDWAFLATLILAPVLSATIWGWLAWSDAQKKRPFCQLAEKIFSTFGWPDVDNLDLRKTSTANRRSNIMKNFGRYYFRYQ